jgi:Oxidoreductase family, NAD-binding Rossmann fold/Oxidoreductase family, C-terminal alpha/beta domain
MANAHARTARKYNRRRWLKTVATAAGSVATSRLIEVPSISAETSPNSKLAVAVIGCGGRGEASLQAALSEKVVALVDIDDARLEAAAKKASDAGAAPRRFNDYRKMLDTMHSEIDAVFVATPDHHHAGASMRAIDFGKHVFCEKPLCHDISEARALAKAAKAHKVTTMMGNQGHCEEGYRRVCEYIWAGAIGDVVETHTWSGFVNGGVGVRTPSKPVPPGVHWDEWLGPSAFREYRDGLHPLYWRYWWDFGTGSLGDWGCHNLDGVFWALKPCAPTSIECLGTIGGSEEKYPQCSVIRWNIPPRGSLPGLKVYWYDGGRLPADTALQRKGLIQVPNYPPMLAEFEKKYDSDFREGWDGGTFYMGSKGIMHSGCYGKAARLLPDEAQRAFPVPAARIPRIKGSHFDHFIECCKENKPTCADFEYAAALTEFLLLGHLAIRAGVGAKVVWDGVNMRCSNLPELSALVQPKYRKGWGLRATQHGLKG